MNKKIVVAVFLIFGIWVSSYGFNFYKKQKASLNWPTTNGRITSSEVVWSRKYRAKVMFEYTVSNKSYTSGRISFVEASYKFPRHPQAIIRQYPAGREVTVYYDPTKPENAILEPGKIGGAWIAFVIGAICIATAILTIAK